MAEGRRSQAAALAAARRTSWIPTSFVVMLVAISHGATWIYFRTVLFGTYMGESIDPDRVMLNLRLAQVSYVGIALWFVLLSRRRITPHSGNGLVLAIFGLHARLLSEFARDGTEMVVRNTTLSSTQPPHTPAMFHEMAGTAYESQVALVGNLGLAAFALGLSAAAVVVLIELRAGPN